MPGCWKPYSKRQKRRMDSTESKISLVVRSSHYLLFAVILLALSAAIYLTLKQPINSFYSALYLLPLAFGFLSIISFSNLNYLFGQVAFKIIYGQMFIRSVLVPVLLANDSPLFGGIMSMHTGTSISLLIYEMLVVFTAFFIIARKPDSKKPQNFKLFNRDIVTIGVLLLAAAVVLLEGSVISSVNFIWSLQEYFLDTETRDSIRDSNGLVFLTFNLLRILTLLVLFSMIYKLKISNKWKWLLSLSIVVFNATIIVGHSRNSIIYSTIPLFFIISEFYPTYKKQLATIGGTFFAVIILAVSVIKFSTSDDQAGLIDVFSLERFNAYFSGIENLSLGIEAYNTKAQVNGANYMISDLFQNVPVLSGFVRQEYRTTNVYNYLYYTGNANDSQIVPVQISALFHFGYTLSIFYSFVLTLIAFRIERLANSVGFIGAKYVLYSLVISTSCFMMLNIGTIFSRLVVEVCFTLVPFYTIILLSENYMNLKVHFARWKNSIS